MVLRDPNQPKNPPSSEQPKRRLPRGWWIWLIVALALIALVFGFGVYKLGWEGPTTRIVTRLIPYPAAMVNGAAIRYSDYQDDVLILKRFYDNTRKTAPPGSIFPTQEEIETRVLDRLIKDQLAEEAAARYGIVVTNEDVDKAYQTTILDQSALESASGRVQAESRAEATLDDLYGLRPAQFKTRVLRPFLIRQKLEARLSTDEALNAEKIKKAEAAAAELKAGKDFKEVVAAYGEDPNAATSGGDRGWIVPGLMPAEVDTVIFAMKKGDVSEVVKSPLGYHVFRVADVKTSGGKTTSVRLQEILIQPISLDAYLDAQMKTADIIKFVQ